MKKVPIIDIKPLTIINQFESEKKIKQEKHAEHKWNYAEKEDLLQFLTDNNFDEKWEMKVWSVIPLTFE